jgi:hypothetical protein
VEDEEEDISGDGKGTISAVLGLVTVLTLVYFVFSSPGVLARWTEGNYQLIVITVSLFSLLWFALTLVKPSLLSQLKPSLINLWNIAFALSLVSTILVHTIKFPPTLDSPPVVVTSPFWYEQIPLVLTLLLFPVVFVDFGLFADRFRIPTRCPLPGHPGLHEHFYQRLGVRGTGQHRIQKQILASLHLDFRGDCSPRCGPSQRRINKMES